MKKTKYSPCTFNGDIKEFNSSHTYPLRKAAWRTVSPTKANRNMAIDLWKTSFAKFFNLNSLLFSVNQFCTYNTYKDLGLENFTDKRLFRIWY